MRLPVVVFVVILAVSASSVMGMGKKDRSKKDTEKDLAKSEVVAATKAPAKKETKPAAAAPKKEEAPVPAERVDPESVVVTVDGKEIKEADVQAKIDEAVQMQIKRMGPAAANLPAGSFDQLRDRMRKDIVEGMVMETILNRKIADAKIEITDEEVGARIDEIMKMNNATLEDVKAELAKNGVKFEDFKEQMKKNLGIERLVETEMEAEGQSPKVTEEEAKKYYEENPKQFSQEEQVRASHILIKADMKDEKSKEEAKKKLAGILEKARAGEDFAALAKEYSEDPGSKDKGGEYTFGRGRMVKPFEEAAFSLEPGQISDIVETNYGYHIIKLSEKIPAEKKSFDEVKDRLVTELANRKKGMFWRTYQTKIKGEAKIEYSEAEKARMEKQPANPGMMMPPGHPQ